MKQKSWITLLTYLAYCVDKELYKAIDYLKEQVRVLLEHQEKQNERVLVAKTGEVWLALSNIRYAGTAPWPSASASLRRLAVSVARWAMSDAVSPDFRCIA